MTISIQGLGSLGMSRKAQAYIRREIRTLIKNKKYSAKRAVAAAFAMARKKGYSIPGR